MRSTISGFRATIRSCDNELGNSSNIPRNIAADLPGAGDFEWTNRNSKDEKSKYNACESAPKVPIFFLALLSQDVTLHFIIFTMPRLL